jgi:hypothetical protein
MYRETERKDWTMQKIGYFKSILYAISRSFEPERPTPLLGLEESIRADPALVAHFGLGGAPVAKASVIWSETGKDAPAMLRSNSRTHGFDWEPDSMTAVLLGVLGTGSAAVTPFPKKPERALFDEEADGPWSELDALVQEMGASAIPSNLSFEAAPEPATPVVSGGATGSRRALSFAIDAYPTSPLGGCVADQRLWSALLRKRGFELKTYADHECTRSTMLGALNDAVGRTRAGDELVIHYSGHGTHFDDETGDEEDNQDEAVVPVDHEASPCIMDDELRELFARLPDGARVTLFMDCCHSGTITRFGVGRPAPGAGRARFIQPTPQMKALYARQRSGRSRAPGGVSAMRHAQFAACLDRQVALEDRGYGRFSLVATRVLEAQQTLSRAELLKAVQRGFREAGYNDQDPMLDAPAALLNDRVF